MLYKIIYWTQIIKFNCLNIFTRLSTGLRSSSSTAWIYLQDYLQDSAHQAQLPEYIYKINYWTLIIKLNCMNIFTRSSIGLRSWSSTAQIYIYKIIYRTQIMKLNCSNIYLQDHLQDSDHQVQLPEHIYKIIYRTHIIKLNCLNILTRLSTGHRSSS